MPEENQEVETAPSATYVAPNAPFLKFRLSNSKEVKFDHGSFSTSDPHEIKEIDACIKNSPSFSQLVKKVDVTAAEEIAKAHMAKQRDAGISGPFTSEHTQIMSTAMLEDRDKQIQNLDTDNADFAKEAAESGLVMSEAGTKLPGTAADDPDLRQPVEEKAPAVDPMKVLGKK